MALVASQKSPNARGDYTVAPSRPECLNQVTSPAADSLSCCCAALLNARQTASPVTACGGSNDYLSSRIGPARSKPMRTAQGTTAL